MPTLQRCFKYRIRPTAEQEQQFRQWSGCRRLVWNHFLARRQDTYRETGKTLSLAAMCRELTLLKRQPQFLFLVECDSQALQQVLRDLHTAYVHFFEKRTGFPKRKSRKKTTNAFRIPQRVSPPEGGFVGLPKVGAVEILLHRPLEGVVKSATVKQEPAGKWTITFVTHFQAPEAATGESQNPIGLDAGLETFVTTSDGKKMPHPRFYRKQERKLKRTQRKCSRGQKGSKNKSKARKGLSVLHARVRNQRQDWLHKRSRALCDRHDVICIEDLAISALVKTKLRGHSKSWHDAGWGTFRSQLTYKQAWQGRRLVVVSRWYPSSQECSVCHVRTKERRNN